jgi:hypothetical protein
MKRSAVIVTLSIVALVLSTAALARGDEVVRKHYTVQTATTSQAQEALAKLREQEAAILKQMSEIYKSIAEGQKARK